MNNNQWEVVKKLPADPLWTHQQEIRASLATLTRITNTLDHVDPEKVDWAVVGSFGYVNEKLQEIVEFLTHSEV
jgi:hypothetical protein